MNNALFARTNAVQQYIDATLDLSGSNGLLMVAGGNGLIVNASATVPATFVLLDGQKAGRPNSVAVLGMTPPVRMVAAGAIPQFSRVCQDAGGGVKVSPGSGNARVDMGVALEAATNAGQFIIVQPFTPAIGS